MNNIKKAMLRVFSSAAKTGFEDLSHPLLSALGEVLDEYVETFAVQPDNPDLEITEETAYLKRWYLMRLREPEKYPRLHKLTRFLKRRLGFEVYLHCISKDDADRHLHDHPWPFVAFILCGGYIEEVPEADTAGVAVSDREERRHHAGDYHTKTEHNFHRVKLFRDEDGKEIPSWSIIIRGRKKKDWGFSTEDGWKDHTHYLNDLYGEGNWEREQHDYDEEISS